MAQWLRVQAALAEDLGLVTNTHIEVTWNSNSTLAPGIYQACIVTHLHIFKKNAYTQEKIDSDF